ncbi:putative autophagy-related protein 11 isoform X2 [Prorops nasuta]|uniref:putative autophagy-related protein 11 isoform X2 n=1 Tax=Prorops nasuta TaxID=863751 RepID=UPI0034CF42D7
MSNSMKGSDDEPEIKSGRRRRTISNLSIPGSPLRRSSRIKQNRESSPDSCISEYTSTQSKRTSNRTQKNTELLASRKSFSTGGSSEVSTGNSQKGNSQSKHFIRAASETRSPAITGEFTRNTRSRSIGPEEERELGVKDPVKNGRYYRRASVLPCEPTVAEKEDENLAEIEEENGSRESFVIEKRKALEEEAKLNSVSIVLENVRAEELINISRNNSLKPENTIVNDNKSTIGVELDCNKSQNSEGDSVNNKNNSAILEVKNSSISMQESCGNKENLVINIIQANSDFSNIQKDLLNTEPLQNSVEENKIFSTADNSIKFNDIEIITDSAVIDTKSSRLSNAEIDSKFKETIELEPKDISANITNEPGNSSVSPNDNFNLNSNNEISSKGGLNENLTDNCDKQASLIEDTSIKIEMDDDEDKANDDSMAKIVLSNDKVSSNKEIIEIKVETKLCEFDSQKDNEVSVKSSSEESTKIDEGMDSLKALKSLEEEIGNSPQKFNCTPSKLSTCDVPKILNAEVTATGGELDVEIKTNSPSRKHETKKSGSNDTQEMDDISDEVAKDFFKDIIIHGWNADSTSVNGSIHSTSIENDSFDLKYQESNNDEDENKEEIRENDSDNNRNMDGNSSVVNIDEEVSSLHVSEEDKLLTADVSVHDINEVVNEKDNYKDEDINKNNEVVNEQCIVENIKQDHEISPEITYKDEISKNRNSVSREDIDTDGLDNGRVTLRNEDNSFIPEEVHSNIKKHTNKLCSSILTSTPNKDFTGETKEIAYKKFMKSDNENLVKINTKLNERNQLPQQDSTQELNISNNESIEIKSDIDNFTKKVHKSNLNKTDTGDYKSQTTKFLKKQKLNESAPSALSLASTCSVDSTNNIHEKHNDSNSLRKKDLLENSLDTGKNKKRKELEIFHPEDTNKDLVTNTSIDENSQDFVEKKLDEQLNTSRNTKKRRKRHSGQESEFTEESILEEKCETATNITGGVERENTANRILNNSDEEKSYLKQKSDESVGSKVEMQDNNEDVPHLSKKKNSKKLNNNSQEEDGQLTELKPRNENTNESKKKKKKHKKESKQLLENKSENTVPSSVEVVKSESSENLSKKKKKKRKQKNSDILEAESHIIGSKLSETSIKDKNKRKEQGKEDEVSKVLDIVEQGADSEISLNPKKNKKKKKQQIEENPFIDDNVEIIKQEVESERSHSLKKNKNKGRQVKEQIYDKPMEVEEVNIQSQKTKSKDKKHKKRKEIDEETEAEQQLDDKAGADFSQSGLKEKKKKLKKGESKIEVTEDNQMPECVSFSEARLEALQIIQNQIDAINARKKQKNKKLQEQSKPTSEQPVTPKGIKRLPETVLEELPDVPIPHLKRQKKRKESEQVMSTRTMFNLNEFRKCKNKEEDNDFIPLSLSGSTTQFKVVSIEKVKKGLPNNASNAANFRERVLSKNSRHPMSTYISNLKKQKASGKGRFAEDIH